MKIVTCENCGAKYQLEDNEPTDYYECSSCAGFLEDDGNENSLDNSKNLNSKNNSNIVYCDSCGLRYLFDSNKHIHAYECSSCGGNLRYSDENLNKRTEQENIPVIKQDLNIQNKNDRNEEYRTNFNLYPNHSSLLQDSRKDDFKNQIKEKFSNSLDKDYQNLSDVYKPNNDLSHSYSHQDMDEEENLDYDNIESIESQIQNKSFNMNIHDKKTISSKNNTDNLPIEDDKSSDDFVENDILNSGEDNFQKSKKDNDFGNVKKQELVTDPNTNTGSYHDIYIIVGLIIAIIGFADVILTVRLYGLAILIFGILLFVLGVFKNNKYDDSEFRGKIIRESLLTLPENFYILYFVKVPKSNGAINHVVIGPSGIFSILTQNYDNKNKKDKSKLDIENESLISDKSKNIHSKNVSYLKDTLPKELTGNTDTTDNRNNQTQFKFDKKGQIKFDNNSKIKHKAIRFSEDLINFLNENGLNANVEPLVGFVNKDVAIINMPLTDEDLFLEELLMMIAHGENKLDDSLIHKIAILLSQYSAECTS
jgi:hypothetical protein